MNSVIPHTHTRTVWKTIPVIYPQCNAPTHRQFITQEILKSSNGDERHAKKCSKTVHWALPEMQESKATQGSRGLVGKGGQIAEGGWWRGWYPRYMQHLRDTGCFEAKAVRVPAQVIHLRCF